MKPSKINIRLAALAILVAACISAAVQSAPAPARPPDAAQAVVIKELAVRVHFDADGTGWREVRAVYQVQSAAGVQGLGVLPFPYVSGFQSVTVDYVRVHKPDGTVVLTPPENIRDLPDDVSRVAPVYSDGMVKQVLVKGLEAGDTLEYQARIQQIKADVPGQFWFAYDFQRAVITDSEDLELDVPDSIYLNLYSPEIKPAVEAKAGRRVYRWHTSNTALPPADGPEEAHAPAVEATTSRNWADVGEWYGALAQPPAAVTPAIQAKAEEITRGVSGDDAKIAALYTFVMSHIHYISISIGSGRYQPHPAAEVLSNGYGDCKDQVTLMIALLRASGYTAVPALVSLSGPVTDSVPSPMQFDHVVTLVQRPQGSLWLDTTPGVAPPGWLSPQLRGNSALVIDSPARLEKPPADLPYASLSKYQFQGTLSSAGTLAGHVDQQSRGDGEIVLRAGFEAATEARWTDLAQQIARFEGFGGTVTSVQVSPPMDTSKPFQWSYDYSRDSYSDWTQHYITPPMPPMVLPDADKALADGIDLGSANSSVDYRTTMSLPQGYGIAPRSAVDLVNDFAEYHATYTFKDRTLTAERRIVVKMDKVPAAEEATYKKFVQAVSDDEAAWLTVTSATAARGTAESQAAEMNDAGYKAYRAGDFKTAGDDLHMAVTLDPKNSGAWNDLGLLDAHLGHLQDAIADYQKAIAISSDDPYAYNNMGLALVGLRRFDDAEQAYRQQIRIAPSDRYAYANLGSLLIEEQKYPDAVALLKTGAAAADNTNVEITLGEAELDSGDTAGGEAALDKAVQLSPSPLTFNNVAYQLSLHADDLDKAHQYAQSAVASLQGMLASVELKNMQPAQLGEVRLLGDSWDTLGWIDFRQGDISAAESYVAAAWNLNENGVEGDHLGQIYEKEGRTDAAEAMYEMAGSQADGEHARTRLAALAGGAENAALLMSQHAGDASQRRTITVSGVAGVSGHATAQFYISLEPGPKVVEVQFISGDDVLRAAAPALEAAHYDILFPLHEITRIVRRGLLSCGPGAMLDAHGQAVQCTFVLVPVH